MPRVSQADIDAPRRRRITTLLRGRSYLPVGEVCRRLNISEATARRDLAALAEGKAIVRTFGGAVADYDRRFAPFADRLAVAAAAKAGSLAAAWTLIRPGTTLFVDAGTTPFAVATRLAKVPVAVRVVTNSLAVAERLSRVTGIDIDLLGGRLVASQSVLLGPDACAAAERYEYDLAVLGAEGFDAAGVWNSTAEVTALQRAVVGRARRHAICADATKAGQIAPALLMNWTEVDQLITDTTSDAVPMGVDVLVA